MDYHIPKGVSVETLREIVIGWAATGGAVEPQQTTAVAKWTGITDAVGRQTRFLEAVGILEQVGQNHRLTDAGKSLAGALMIPDPALAAEQANELLADWDLTDKVRGILRANPLPRATIVPLVATLAGEDLSASRVRTGITTLLDLFEWADIVARDAEGRYCVAETDDGVTVATRAMTDAAQTASPSLVVPAVRLNGEADTEVSEITLVSIGDGDHEPSLGLGPIAQAVSTATSEEAVDAAAAQPAADDTHSDGMQNAHSHALSLTVDVDADATDLESIVTAIRRGVIEGST